MSKMRVNTREIGSVCVFDLLGDPTDEDLLDVANKIQRNIRRHRFQRIILNLQMIPSLEPIGLRRLLSACIRPQKGLIFGVSPTLETYLESTYVPKNMKICRSEREVAEDFGPFLLEKNLEGFPNDPLGLDQDSIGAGIERRRSKRMHVALPIELKLYAANGRVIETKAIATNISEGGLFAEYLDLEASRLVETLEPIQDVRASITIYPSANFPEEYHLEAKIRRREFRRRQVGIAVEFTA